MLVKEWESSRSLSQPPLLVMPHSVSSKMKKEDLSPQLRTPLPDRSVKEFLKTANLVAQDPWLLHGAKAYLTEWVDKNVNGTYNSPDPVEFIFKEGGFHDLGVPSAHGRWLCQVAVGPL